MIIWNIKKLKKNIAEEKVNEKQYFIYFLFLTTITGLLSAVSSSESLITVAADVLLMIFCFRVSKKLKVDRFIEKYAAIFFVAMMRLNLFFFPLTIATLIALSFFGPDRILFIISISSDLSVLIFSKLILLCSCTYIYYHFKDLCNQCKNHATQPLIEA